MKQYLLILALLLVAVCSQAQNTSDQAVILQKIIDLPNLQQCYPMAPDNKHREVYIWKSSFSIDSNLQLIKFEKKVLIVDKEDFLKNQSLAYFVFKSLETTDNTASVEFDFNYTMTTTKQSFHGIVILKKSGEDWNITDTKLSRR